MPKVTLEYQLPEEQDAYDDARRGPDYASAIDNLYNWLRSQWKYDAGDISPDAAEKVWEFLYNEIREE